MTELTDHPQVLINALMRADDTGAVVEEIPEIRIRVGGCVVLYRDLEEGDGSIEVTPDDTGGVCQYSVQVPFYDREQLGVDFSTERTDGPKGRVSVSYTYDSCQNTYTDYNATSYTIDSDHNLVFDQIDPITYLSDDLLPMHRELWRTLADVYSSIEDVVKDTKSSSTQNPLREIRDQIRALDYSELVKQVRTLLER